MSISERAREELETKRAREKKKKIKSETKKWTVMWESTESQNYIKMKQPRHTDQVACVRTHMICSSSAHHFRIPRSPQNSLKRPKLGLLIKFLKNLRFTESKIMSKNKKRA